ncbi:hypothetical protein KUTeg_010187 [Tegillarca granosa]|uniref:Uncharacterized protein n=1 Tax=Tegillarca granosa TaxID=220873 RepID=A0ABQ9F616_TEGGR|nr:hypothetical protein KUTeg_010187 [Tegillarca granosa]
MGIDEVWGVFQTLVEKHFPAPNRKKTFDIFGFGGYSSLNNDTKTSTPKNLKRKNEQSSSSLNTKKSKKSKGSDSSSGSEDSSDDDDDDLDDLDLSSDSSDSENPWLKKTKGTNNKSRVKNKKVKPKKNKKKSKDIDEDEEFDKALAAAGLLKKPGSVPDNLSKMNGNSNNGHSSIGNNNSFMGLGNGNGVEKAGSMKQELLDMLEEIGENLPPNTLDHLIDELGGPENVAEMTGRKGRVVSTDDGISYESRSESDVPLEILNLTEKQRFMDGEKNIAIISEAASSGISLQADRRAINQKRRVHVTLELPWSADRAIQQFGRTHRSNQVNAPEYVFMISELAGEQRFASTVAKRLESLGALTHGDRRATESRDLSRFNFDNKYGRAALENVIKSVLGFEHPLVAPPAYGKGDFFEDVKTGLIGVGMVTVEEGMSVPLLDKDLGSGGESVKKLETKIFVGNTATNTAKTELTTVSVERGMSWNNAMEIWRKHMGVDDGFYISLNDNNIKKMAILIVYQGLNKKKEKVYNVYRPNTGHQKNPETLTNIKKRYKKVLPNVAETWWNDQYDNSATKCFHMYWKGSCRKMSLGLPCEIGLRTRKYHILSGSVLSVWSKVESVLASVPGGMNSKMQIMRLRTDSNERIVGSLIPSNCLGSLCNILSQDCSRTYTEKHTQPLTEEENVLSMPLLF